MTTEIATFIAAITGLVTAVASLIGIILTHGKVGTVNDAIDAVKVDTQIIKNGAGETHDPPSV